MIIAYIIMSVADTWVLKLDYCTLLIDDEEAI